MNLFLHWRGEDERELQGIGWFDDQGEVLDAGNFGWSAVGRVVWVRRVACQSSPRISTWPVGLSGVRAMAGGSDEGLGAEEGLGAAGFEGDVCEAEGDDAEAYACADGYACVDAELGDGAVDEGGEAEDEAEGGGSGEGEDAVAGEFGLEGHHDEGGEEEHDGGVADGQEVDAEESEEDEEGTDGAGTTVPGTLNSR